eukprot:7611194-Pyramimonas_sp.AAC.1
MDHRLLPRRWSGLLVLGPRTETKNQIHGCRGGGLVGKHGGLASQIPDVMICIASTHRRG